MNSISFARNEFSQFPRFGLYIYAFQGENHHGGARAMQWLFSALDKKYTTLVHPFLRDMIRINQMINIHTLYIGTCCILMHIQLWPQILLICEDFIVASARYKTSMELVLDLS